MAWLLFPFLQKSRPCLTDLLRSMTHPQYRPMAIYYLRVSPRPNRSKFSWVNLRRIRKLLKIILPQTHSLSSMKQNPSYSASPNSYQSLKLLPISLIILGNSLCQKSAQQSFLLSHFTLALRKVTKKNELSVWPKWAHSAAQPHKKNLMASQWSGTKRSKFTIETPSVRNFTSSASLQVATPSSVRVAICAITFANIRRRDPFCAISATSSLRRVVIWVAIWRMFTVGLARTKLTNSKRSLDLKQEYSPMRMKRKRQRRSKMMSEINLKIVQNVYIPKEVWLWNWFIMRPIK